MRVVSKEIFAGVIALLCLSIRPSAMAQLAEKDLDMGPWMNCASPDDNGLYFHSDKMKVQTEDQYEKKYTFDGHAVHIGKRDMVVSGQKLIEGKKVWISSESSDWPGGCPEGGLLKSAPKAAAPTTGATSPAAPTVPAAPSVAPSAPAQPESTPAQPASAPSAAPASASSATDPSTAQTSQTAVAGMGQCGPGKGGPGPQGSVCGTYSTTGSPWDCRPDASIKSCPFIKLQPLTAP